MQVANRKSKRNLTKKNQLKKLKKNKNRLFFFWGGGGILSLLFSCYALAALQSPTINQDIRHKTTTRSTISTLTSFNDTNAKKKRKYKTKTRRLTNWLSTEAVQRLKQVRLTSAFSIESRFPRVLEVDRRVCRQPTFPHVVVSARVHLRKACSRLEARGWWVFSFHWRAPQAAPDRPLQGAMIAPGRPSGGHAALCRLSRSPSDPTFPVYAVGSGSGIAE